MIIKPKTKRIIEQALKEDIGTGDITTGSIIEKKQQGKFLILSNQPCVVCGMALAEACFTMTDKDVHFRPMVSDGGYVSKGKIVAHIEGRCYGVLIAERTALNFLGWLSGISTLTNKFVNAVKNYKAQIMDTRKTIPTLRYLQKYAVKIGGGKNHRMGLYDQILIKDNHLSAVDDIKTAIERARKIYGVGAASPHIRSGQAGREGKKIRPDTKGAGAPTAKKIEIEVKNLGEFKKALSLNPDIIMLDNMKINDIKEAVQLRDAYRIKKQDIGFKTLLEVSGNVNLDNVVEIAKAGLDRISIGALTHSAPAIDFSLKAE